MLDGQRRRFNCRSASSGPDAVLKRAMRSYENFIGGDWVSAQSGQTFTNLNPADTREAVAQYPQGGRADALAAIAAAQAAAPGWADQPEFSANRVGPA